MIKRFKQYLNKTGIDTKIKKMLKQFKTLFLGVNVISHPHKTIH